MDPTINRRVYKSLTFPYKFLFSVYYGEYTVWRIIQCYLVVQHCFVRRANVQHNHFCYYNMHVGMNGKTLAGSEESSEKWITIVFLVILLT